MNKTQYSDEKIKFTTAADVKIIATKTHEHSPDWLPDLDLKIARPELLWVQALVNSIKVIEYALKPNPFWENNSIFKFNKFIPYAAHFVNNPKYIIFVNRGYCVLHSKGGFIHGNHNSFEELFAERTDPAIQMLAKEAYLTVSHDFSSHYFYDDWTQTRKQAEKIKRLLIKAVGMS